MEISKCMGCMEEYRGYPCPNCGYTPGDKQGATYFLPHETIVGGKYLVGRVLGQGGFGITYIGWDIALARKVAIKEYYPSGHVSRMPGTRSLIWYSSEQASAAQIDGMDMFMKEARKMAKLEDIPGIVKIRDLFQENDTAYIVMDYVEGHTLKDKLREHGPMPWEQAMPLFLSAIHAMERVHAAGLIHRDLSPDNLMLTPDGGVKILDLGAAKDLKLNSGASSMQVAKGGFSPYEQYTQRGGSGTWTDVYAMAATIYYTLTGKVPPAAMDRMVEDNLRWDHPNLLSLPAPALNALKKAMGLLPKDRIQTMAEFGRQLMLIDAQKPPRRPRKALIAGAAAVLVGVVGLSLALRTPGKTPTSGETSASIQASASGKDTDILLPPKNWEDTVDARISAGTQDIYTFASGARMKQFFDGDNEVARILINENGEVEYTYKACYDDNGKILIELAYDGLGKLWRQERITRNDQGDVLERQVCDGEGNQISRVTLTRNSDSKVLSSRTYDENDQLISSTSTTYDSQGRDIAWEKLDRNSQRTAWSTTSYDASGLGTKTYHEADGTIRQYRNDKDGNLLEYTSTKPDGKLDYRGVYDYDEAGNQIEWRYYRGGELSFRSVYEFDGDKRIREISYNYYSYNETITTSDYLYAAHDLEVGTSSRENTHENFKSLQGNIMRAYGHYVYTSSESSSVSYYDWDAKLQKIISVDENGEITSKSIYHYDDDGEDLGYTFYYYSSYSDTTSVTEYDTNYEVVSEKTYPGKTKLLEA